MKPIQNLPPGYLEKGSLDLKQNTRALVWLNLLGAGLLVASAWLLVQAALWLRPVEAAPLVKGWLRFSFSLGEALLLIVDLLAIMLVMLALHEAIHGLFFWLFTGQRPVFGFGPGYAYAAAPAWYIPRSQYLVVGLAPLVVISILGLLLLAVVSPGWFLVVIAFAAFNASGAIGDIAVAVWLLGQPTTCLANDRGDAVTLYCPAR